MDRSDRRSGDESSRPARPRADENSGLSGDSGLTGFAPPRPTMEASRRAPISSVKIEVFDNQIEPALKALKKQMLAAGVFKEMKRRAHYEKPSVKRKRKQAEARKKRRKALKRSGAFEGSDG